MMTAATSFQDWQSIQSHDSGFVVESRRLEPGYQVARLRLLRKLTRAQLARMAGTSPASIARLENGNSLHSLSFLERITEALDATLK